jgi:hypothetical protein
MSSCPAGYVSGLLTDLYELTMAAGYVQKHFAAQATFELFVRHLPMPSYLLALGDSSQPFPVHYSTQLEKLCEQIRKAFVKSSFVSSSQADLGRKLA